MRWAVGSSFSYDALDRQVAVTDPLNNISTTVYDAAGEVIAAVDGPRKSEQASLMTSPAARRP